MALPAGAASDKAELTLSVADRDIALEAHAVPLDRLLASVGEKLDIAVRVQCSGGGCPVFEGRLRGSLKDVLAWILHDQDYSLIYGPSGSAGEPARLERLIVMAKPRAPAEAAVAEGAEEDGAPIYVWQSNPARSPAQLPPHELDTAVLRRIFARTGLRAGELLSDDGLSGGEPVLASRTSPEEEGALYYQLKGLRALPLLAPLARYRIASDFGPRRDPVTGRQARHQGIDLAAPARAQVLSTAPGVVVTASWEGAYGRMVEVDHGFGLKTRYGHLAQTLVRPGQAVRAGDPLGVIGSSGRSTGRHLHYEVRVKGRPVDPMRFLQAGRLELEG
jgi:murein DD-endopeptidase MepM/ murein hydrolase activator NlpD